MTSQNYPMGSIVNSDGPQRMPVCPLRSQDSRIRVKYRLFPIGKNTVKKMSYGHWTGYNLLPTGSDGITSPDIVSIVHKVKCKTIYLKLIVPLLRIIRSQKDSVISRTESIKLYYAAALKPGTKNWFPEQLSSKWRRRTIPRGLKWTLMAPRERLFAPKVIRCIDSDK